MRVQQLKVQITREKEIKTTQISPEIPMAQLTDTGELVFKIEWPMQDGTWDIYAVTFNRYETQKIRALLSHTGGS